MKTDAQLSSRDSKRNVGAELLEAVREMKSGHVARTTTFEVLPDGSVRRTVADSAGGLGKQDILTGAQ